MQLHIPTVFVLIVVTTLVLALSIAVVSGREDHDGLRPFIGALLLNSLVYVLFALRGRIPDVISIWLANVMVSAAYALTLRAIADFQQRRQPRWKYMAPLIACALGFALFAPSMLTRVAIGSAIYLSQTALLLHALITGVKRTAGRGQFLVISGVALNMGAVVVRGIVLFIAESETVLAVADAGLSQSVIYVSAFIALNLVSVGFVLMLKEHADEINKRMAVTDPLTGCWNRVRIKQSADLEMARQRRYGEPVALLVIDIDFFKAVNDRHGHVAGDQLLSEFAQAVRACLREADQFGRWGGEEFVVLLPASDAVAAASIAERIRATVAASTFGTDLRITASLGYAEYQSAESFEAWIERADAALYRAKEAGRNRVEPRIAAPADSHAGEGIRHNLVRIVWKPEYETGHAEIDAQHRRLFDHGNRLLAAILSDAPPSVIQGMATHFIAFARQHFATEEKILADRKSPYADEHTHKHQRLLETANGMMENIGREQFNAADFLGFFVHELVLQHMLTDDCRLSQTLRTVG